MSFLRSILLLAVAVVLASCQSLTAPPGFASAGSGTAGRIEFPDGVSLEAQYSLLTWYQEEHGTVAKRQAVTAYGVALNARNERAALLRGNAVHSLTSCYPGFAYIPEQGGIAFQYEMLGKRTDFAEMDAMLAACQDALQAPRTVDVPQEECVAFLASYADAKEVDLFRAWASRNAHLVLEVQDVGAQKALRLCREALSLKADLLKGISSVQELLQEGGHDSKVLDILDELSARVGAAKDFSVIGDFETIGDFQTLASGAPLECVNRVLSRLSEESASEAYRFESTLSSSLKAWEKDSRFHETLVQEDERIRGAVNAAFTARMAMIRHLPELAVKSGCFWDEITWANKRLALLQSGNAGDWDCYARYGLFDQLSEGVRSAKEEMHAPAVEFYLQMQAEMASREDRQAVVVALHELLSELCDGEAPAISEARKTKALEILGEQKALCSIGLEEFSSDISQVSGVVWTNDLRSALAQEIIQSNAGALCCMAEDASSPECLVVSGEILEFTSGALETRTETKVHRWYSEPRMEGSPQGIVFVQDLFEEDIASQISSREGGVRVRTGIGWKGADGAWWEGEIGVVQAKKFLQERVLSSEKIRSVRCEDERQTMVPGAPALLHDERVWSEGEMLDFFRHRMLDLWVETIFTNMLQELHSAIHEESDPIALAEDLGEFLNAMKQCHFSEGGSLEVKRQGYLAVLPEQIRQYVTNGLKMEPVKE